MKTLEQLQPLILEWAKERDLLHEEIAPKQRLKLIEKCGELASAILKNDIDKQKDAIGDIFVVMIILYEQLDRYFEFHYECSDSEIFDGDLEDNFEEILNVFNSLHTYAFVNLYYLANSLDLDLTECANIAYNEIRD